MANVNDMLVFQAGTILKSIVQQATGQTVITATTPGEFVSVAQTALKIGYDPLSTRYPRCGERPFSASVPMNGS